MQPLQGGGANVMTTELARPCSVRGGTPAHPRDTFTGFAAEGVLPAMTAAAAATGPSCLRDC